MAELILAEEWRPVPGYEEWYEVSNLGRVRTVPRILQPWPIPNGARYLSLAISASGPVYGSKIKTGGQKVVVHRLVAEAFLGPQPEGHNINHKDGNRANNCLSNIEYTTPSQNIKHSYDHLRRVSVRGRKGLSHKLTNTQVSGILLLLQFGMKQAIVAKTFGVTSGAVYWHARKRKV